MSLDTNRSSMHSHHDHDHHDHHDHHAHAHPVEQSNLKEGLIGIAVAVVGLGIIMWLAYWLAMHG